MLVIVAMRCPLRTLWFCALALGWTFALGAREPVWPAPYPKPSLEEEQTKEVLSYFRVPKLEFREVLFPTVLQTLEKEIRAADPDGIGYKIELEPTRARAAQFQWQPAEELPITLSLMNLTAYEAVNLVTIWAGCKFRRTGRSLRVRFDPALCVMGVMEGETIPLPPQVFGRRAKPEDYGANPEEIAKFMAQPEEYLRSRGVWFWEGLSARIDDERGPLQLQSFGVHLERIHQVLEALIPPPVPGPEETKWDLDVPAVVPPGREESIFRREYLVPPGAEVPELAVPYDHREPSKPSDPEMRPVLLPPGLERILLAKWEVQKRVQDEVAAAWKAYYASSAWPLELQRQERLRTLKPRP